MGNENYVKSLGGYEVGSLYRMVSTFVVVGFASNGGTTRIKNGDIVVLTKGPWTYNRLGNCRATVFTSDGHHVEIGWFPRDWERVMDKS